jgi:hypothetical protein
MKYILLYEAYTTSDQDITQRILDRDKMIQDYKKNAGILTSAYLNDNKDPEPAYQSIIKRTLIKRGTNTIQNTYLVKLAEIQRDERKVRELESNLKGGKEKSTEIKSPTDKTQGPQMAQELANVKNDIKSTSDELNTLRARVAKKYKEFDKDMKDAIKDTKEEVADMKRNA